MRIPVLCVNPACEHFLVRRDVAPQHLGQDVYLTSEIFCACSWPLLKGVQVNEYLTWAGDQERAREGYSPLPEKPET